MTELRAIALHPAQHTPHPLHAAHRPWPETNCYLDLWIELLHALGRDPLPLLGLAVSLGWEADHFTFLKPCAADIFAVTGIALHELALWDETEAHVAAQLQAGSIPLLEVDSYFLPDTQGSAYRDRHTKTTIAITAMDPAVPWLEYFHNAGLFRLSGDDFAGILGRREHRPALFPYAEMARVTGPAASPHTARRHARHWLARSLQMRAPGDPIACLASALPELLAQTGPDPVRIHTLCFNTTRQLGAAFGLLADHLVWLGEDGSDAARLSEAAKIVQFRLVRCARRGRADPELPLILSELSTSWRRCMAIVERAGEGNPHDEQRSLPLASTAA